MGFSERYMYYWYEELQVFLANRTDTRAVSIDIFMETTRSNTREGWKSDGLQGSGCPQRSILDAQHKAGGVWTGRLSRCISDESLDVGHDIRC